MATAFLQQRRRTGCAQIRLVNAADFSSRAVAPGSLLSVIGGKITRAQAGELNVPVLDAPNRVADPGAVRSRAAASMSTGARIGAGSLLRFRARRLARDLLSTETAPRCGWTPTGNDFDARNLARSARGFRSS